jgi:hypothetical protein
MASLPLPGYGRQEESELVVYLTVAVGLLIGLAVQWSVVSRTETVTAGGSVLSYPASWQRVAEDGALVAAADRSRGGLYGARVSVREVPKAELLPGGGTLADAATNWSLSRSDQLVGYRILSIAERTANGREVATVEYAYLASSPGGSADGAMPGLMHAIDTLVLSGETYQILSFAAEGQEFTMMTTRRPPLFQNVYDRLLRSWQPRQGRL